MDRPASGPAPCARITWWCALVLVTATLVAHAQRQDDRRDFTLLQQWLDAVEQHAPGVLDAPLFGAAAWTGAEIDQLWIDVQMLAHGALDPGRYRFSVTPQPVGTPNRASQSVSRSVPPASRETFDALVTRVRTRGPNAVLRRATLLHTDIVVEAADVAASAGANSSRAGRRWSVGDGTGQGTEGLSVHLDMARLLMAQVSPDPRRDMFVRDWYRATVARQQAAQYYDSLHLTWGLRLFPDDPDLLLMAGAEREAMASPMFQAFARSITSRYDLTGIGSVSKELRTAEGFYRRAVDLQPRFPEARLHLGRVLDQIGRHADAVRELQVALDTGLDGFDQYYAWLFLGAAREALGDGDAALDAYRHATTVAAAPRAALLAIARLARERGDRDLVAESLARALVPAHVDDPIDPFWLYRAAQGRRRMSLLDDVRRQATEDRP